VERILVIYDDSRSQQTVRRILEQAGYDVAIAASDQIAMDVFRATKAGLVILDVCLPGKPTQDLCKQIRDKLENVSILVLSPIGDVEDVVLLLKLGADDYIAKPFNPLEFTARIRAAMRRRENYLRT
jgi:two-component system alkaline phosphatase synthesis response regulator PhoP